MLMRRKIAVGVFLALLVAAVGTAWAVTYTKARAGVEDIKWGYGTWSRATSTGSTVTMSKMSPINVLARGITRNDYTDDSDSLRALFAEVSAVGGGAVYFPEGEYTVDGTIIPIGSNTTVFGEGATLKLKAGAYTSHVYILGTRSDVAYAAGTSYVDNVNIYGLTIDGNIDSVTTAYSSFGIVGHQVNDWIIRDCKVINMPGTEGSGYGISFWYSDRVIVDGCYINRTDRQNVLVWETTNAKIVNSSLRNSNYRECVLVSSFSPPTLKGSSAYIGGCDIINAMPTGTTNITRGIRLSASCDAVIAGCSIRADSSCIASVDSIYKSIQISDCRLVGASIGVEVSTDGAKNLMISNCEIDSTVVGIKYSAAGGSLHVTGNRIMHSTTYPVMLEYANWITFVDNYINGGTYCRVRPTAVAQISGNTITAMSGASYALLIGGTTSAKSYVYGNILTGNTKNYIYSLEAGSHIESGTGTPAGERRMPIGSIYLREDGGVGREAYFKSASSGGTDGWLRRDQLRNAYVDTLTEYTSASGVYADGALLKDGAFIRKVTTAARAADDSLAATEDAVWFLGQSASIFCTLPTYASVTLGKKYTIINTDATDTVFVEANGAETLNGSALRRAYALPPNVYATASFLYIGSSGWVKVD